LAFKEGGAMNIKKAVRANGSIKAAAEALNIPRTTLRRQLAKVTGGLTRVVVIGDSHDKPGRGKEHYRWIGHYVREVDPDHVVHIGDFMSLDSLSAHEMRGSKADREAPTFPDDLASLEEALAAYHSGCPYDLGIPHHITFGNHEHRAWRAAEADPRLMADAPLRIQQAFARYRWTWSDYQKWFFIRGVGFTHVPSNLMGRAVGGKGVCQTIANDSTHSIVFGHTHRAEFRTAAKLGARQSIQVLNAGSAMPDGTVEKYFPDTSPTGFTYGVFLITIDDQGNIVGYSFKAMRELEHEYC
jgi:predicted phosphodiesterase